MALEDAKTQVDRAFTGEGRGLAYENAFGGATSPSSASPSTRP